MAAYGEDLMATDTRRGWGGGNFGQCCSEVGAQRLAEEVVADSSGSSPPNRGCCGGDQPDLRPVAGPDQEFRFDGARTSGHG